MWTLFIYYLGIHQTSPSRTEVFKYPNCVASHPRTNSPPCQREHPHFTMLVLTSIFTTSFFFILLFITFWTNSLVIRWWKELIRSKRILRSTNQKYEVVNWAREAFFIWLTNLRERVGEILKKLSRRWCLFVFFCVFLVLCFEMNTRALKWGRIEAKNLRRGRNKKTGCQSKEWRVSKASKNWGKNFFFVVTFVH